MTDLRKMSNEELLDEYVGNVASGIQVDSDSLEDEINALRAELLRRLAPSEGMPPASQTPLPLEKQLFVDQIYNALSKLESQVYRNPELPLVCKDIVRDGFDAIRNIEKLLATPASTARTDGWIDPENYVAWCRRSKNTIVTCDSDAPGAFKVYRLAAPGSVPQAEPQK